MTAVLLTIMNGTKVVDAGSGVVIARIRESTAISAPQGPLPGAALPGAVAAVGVPPGGAPAPAATQRVKTYVLTCAHNLKALGSRVTDSGDNPLRIFVCGKPAKDIYDAKLARLDLAIVVVDGDVGDARPLQINEEFSGPVRCAGFVGFFQHQFENREVRGNVVQNMNTLMPDGGRITYLKVKPKRGNHFEKGLSGAAVLSQDEKVIGIARILDGPKLGKDGKGEKGQVGYAIQLSAEVVNLVQELVPCQVVGSHSTSDREVPDPLPESIERDDIQKNRWGGSSKTKESPHRELFIEKVKKYEHYFLFNAVLEAKDDHDLVGPFIFHLHDSFAKSVIWIRKTNGRRATLEEICASGTFTLGVQFKDGSQWRSLEYDLEDYKSGELKEYDD